MKGRVLVCDDDEPNLEVTRELLAEEFEFITACDGKTCLDLLATIKPDVALLDIMMPEMDGYEVCRRIQQRKQCPPHPARFR